MARERDLKVAKVIRAAADLLVYLEHETLTPSGEAKRDALAVSLSELYDDMVRAGQAPAIV